MFHRKDLQAPRNSGSNRAQRTQPPIDESLQRHNRHIKGNELFDMVLTVDDWWSMEGKAGDGRCRGNRKRTPISVPLQIFGGKFRWAEGQHRLSRWVVCVARLKRSEALNQGRPMCPVNPKVM